MPAEPIWFNLINNLLIFVNLMRCLFSITPFTQWHPCRGRLQWGMIRYGKNQELDNFELRESSPALPTAVGIAFSLSKGTIFFHDLTPNTNLNVYFHFRT